MDEAYAKEIQIKKAEMKPEVYNKAMNLKNQIREAEHRLKDIEAVRKTENDGAFAYLKRGNSMTRITQTTFKEVLDKEEYIWGNLLRKYELEFKEL